MTTSMMRYNLFKLKAVYSEKKKKKLAAAFFTPITVLQKVCSFHIGYQPVSAKTAQKFHT